MKKIIGLLLVPLFFTLGLFAQQTAVNDLIDKGIKLHDKADYKGAIEFYTKALLLDNKSAHANYEKASSYFALKDYKNAIKYSNQVINSSTDYVDQAYILKGSALDQLGKPNEAVLTYKTALKKYKQNHLLYYNLAITSFNLKEYKDTDEALQHALKLNPFHASSHFLLGLSMITQEKRVQGILALYNYLLLEPKSDRTESALKTLEEEMQKGTKKENDNSVIIALPEKNNEDEFYTAELMLDLMDAAKKNENNKGKSESQLFIENSSSLFIILGELKKDKKGFWWDFYVDYFYTLASTKHTEAFCYYITQSKEEVYAEWLKTNLPNLEAFSEWYKKKIHKF